MAKKPDNKISKNVVRALGIGLGVSLVLNLALGGYLAFGGRSAEDTYAGDSTTEKSFYEDQVTTIQEENDRLSQQVTDLEEQLASAESSSGEENSEDETNNEENSEDNGENEEENTDNHSAQRQSVMSTSREFLETFLTVDTGQENYHQDRRDALASYVSEDILNSIAPEADESSMDTGGHDHSSESGDTEPYTYTQEPESIKVFVQESTLGSDSVNVIALAHSTVEDNMGAGYETHEQYALTLEEQDGSWVITDYSLRQTDEQE